MDNFFITLPYNYEDLKWPLVCTCAGCRSIKPGEQYSKNIEKHSKKNQKILYEKVLQEYQIIYITKGYGKFISHNCEYKITPGTIIILFPGVRHMYKPDTETGWTEYRVGFKGRYFDSLLKNKIISISDPVYNIGLHYILLDYFQSLFDFAKEQNSCGQIQSSATLMMLFAKIICYNRKQEQKNHSNNLVKTIKCEFEDNIYNNIEIKKIAEKQNVSCSYLREVFKSNTGQTPYQYFLQLKISKAKILLSIGKLNIKEISYKLGFKDQYYFSRIFKKKTGVSPSTWVQINYENTEKS